MKVGVLALQGASIEHISAMQQIGVEARAIRLPNQLVNRHTNLPCAVKCDIILPWSQQKS